VKALSALQTEEERQQFLDLLCSPTELRNIDSRWQTFQLLMDGRTHRVARDEAKVSIATVTRANRLLQTSTTDILTKVRERCVSNV
jgi:uncharacterized protein YerC